MKLRLIFLTVAMGLLAPTAIYAFSWGQLPLHDFTGTDGEHLYGGALLLGSDGAYYGEATYGGSAGGGVLYKMVITGNRSHPITTYTILHEFYDGSVTNDGYGPLGGLVEDGAGNFYGVTDSGGAGNGGTVFKYNSSTGVLTILHSFDDGTVANDGVNPSGGLTLDGSGNLYGTTQVGGTSFSDGTIFKLSPSGGGWSYTILHSFSNFSGDGFHPAVTMTLATDGKLYGTAYAGGAHNNGTLFRLDPGTSSFSVLYDFTADPSDSGLAQVPLAYSSGGLLQFFGTTYDGGTANSGTIYSLTQASSGSSSFNFSVVHNFSGGSSDGAGPVGALVFSTAFNMGPYFFGTTANGGGANQGTVYRISAGGSFLELSSYTAWITGPIYGNPCQGLVEGVIGGIPVLIGSCFRGGANGYGYTWEVYLQ